LIAAQSQIDKDNNQSKINDVVLQTADQTKEVANEKDMIIAPIQEFKNGKAVPNLLGLTLIEAKKVLIGKNIEKFQFIGSGIAVEQKPSSNELIRDGDTLIVIFSPKEIG